MQVGVGLSWVGSGIGVWLRSGAGGSGGGGGVQTGKCWRGDWKGAKGQSLTGRG